MTWANKDANWQELINKIQIELNANKHVIDSKKISDIQDYIDFGEISMAFEYLYLEIMEADNSLCVLGLAEVKELALFFDLNYPNECMVDHLFWNKLLGWISKKENEKK